MPVKKLKPSEDFELVIAAAKQKQTVLASYKLPARRTERLLHLIEVKAVTDGKGGMKPGAKPPSGDKAGFPMLGTDERTFELAAQVQVWGRVEDKTNPPEHDHEVQTFDQTARAKLEPAVAARDRK